MKTNQKGFSAVELIIILLVVGLIGATGWIVYNRQQKAKDTNNSTSQDSQQQSTLKLYEDKKETELLEPSKATKKYTNVDFDYSFEYPDNYLLSWGDGLPPSGATIQNAYKIALYAAKSEIEITMDNDVLSMEMVLSPDTVKWYGEAKALAELIKKDLKTIVEASRTSNISDDQKNPNVDGYYGEITEAKIGSQAAYYFDANGAFSTEYVSSNGSGFVLDNLVRVYFVKDNQNRVFRIITSKNNELTKQILDSFKFNL